MVNEGNRAHGTIDDNSVDIKEVSHNHDIHVGAKEDDSDATENSSSFSGTASGNESSSALSDTEVESQFLGDSDFPPTFDGVGSMFPIRKKRLSTQWRNFIHPLMWRCKWTELRIKELEFLASKYAKEIELLDRKKHMPSDQMRVELSGSKSLPFSDRSRAMTPMKRRKRKRVEDKTDIASYMSNHILFSLPENKRSDHVAPKWEDLGNSDPNTTGNDEFGMHCDSDSLQESDFEHVLRKIETEHARVHNLKAQLNSLMTEKFDKFSSSENLSQLVPFSVPSPTFSACDEETLSIGQIFPSSHQMSGYDFEDFMIPDSSVLSFGEAIDIPDIIESTVGLLSSIDVTPYHGPVGDSSEKIVDNIVVHNQAAESEDAVLKTCHTHGQYKSPCNEIVGENESNNMEREHEILGLASEIHFPKNKRKRGERKAGSGNWSRQRPNEPYLDSK